MPTDVNENELYTLRVALQRIGEACRAADVKKLRDRLRSREKARGVKILTDKPFRITIAVLRREEPQLFIKNENFFEARVIRQLKRINKKVLGRQTDE